MDIEAIQQYCLQKENVTEGFPFGGDTLVFKRMEKAFLLVSLDSIPLRCNVKCDPEKAIELREEYPEVILPGYHMNKKHWNTIIVEGVKSTLLKEMIDDSYGLVGKKK
jgi:predicted DNA-binding protein (MmcQ/YjbR family)